MCDAVSATGIAQATRPIATNVGHDQRAGYVAATGFGWTMQRITAIPNAMTATQSQKLVTVRRPEWPAGS
jgi:hypothetical protein